MDGKPEGVSTEICEWSRWEPCDIDPRLQAEPVGIGESINSARWMSGSGRLALFSEAFILTQDVEVDFVAHRNGSSNVQKFRRNPVTPRSSAWNSGNTGPATRSNVGGGNSDHPDSTHND